MLLVALRGPSVPRRVPRSGLRPRVGGMEFTTTYFELLLLALLELPEEATQVLMSTTVSESNESVDEHHSVEQRECS